MINSYTKDEPFFVVDVQDEGERDRHIYYLLPDGARRRVTIDVSLDTPELRTQIGNGLSQGNYKRGRTR